MAERSNTVARSDAEVMASAVEDAAAFETIFERHFAAIHRFAAARVGPIVAEDIAAEVFSTAFDRRNRFDVSAASARPWLYGICANKLRQHHEAERRWLERGAAHLPNATVEDETLSDARVDAAQLAPLLAAALATLSPAERDVLLLHVFAELTHTEIAGVLGIRRGTAKTRLSRGCARLRAVLNQEGYHGRP